MKNKLLFKKKRLITVNAWIMDYPFLHACTLFVYDIYAWKKGLSIIQVFTADMLQFVQLDMLKCIIP